MARVLEHNELLRIRLGQAKSDSDAGIIWSVETDRVKAVVLKLARGHAAYEYNRPQFHDPDYLDIRPLCTMSEIERAAFENVQAGGLAGCPEVGSRAMQRLLVAESEVFSEGWIVVQDGNYRFHVSEEDGITVKIVLREYMTCHIVWEN